MGYLQGNNIHVDQHLTNVAQNFRPKGFFADRIFPVVNVQKQTNMIKTYNQGDLWRIDSTIRSPGTEANKTSFQVSSTSYVCNNYALKTEFSIEDRANADNAFIRDFESGRTTFLQDKLAMDWNRRVAVQVTNTANVGTSANVGSAWTDNANSDPFGDVTTIIEQVEDGTGYRPNRVVFGGESWREFRKNNNIIDKSQNTAINGGANNASVQQAAALLEVEEVLIASAYFNSAEEGVTASLSRVWADRVLVYYAPANPSVEIPSFGYSLRWTANGIPNMEVERLPFDQKTKVDALEIGYYQDELILGSAFGGLIMHTSCSQ